MVLTKSRHYTETPATNLSAIIAPPGTPKGVSHHVAPVGVTDTFLRLRAQFTMCVAVGNVSSDIPPEGWWPLTTVTLVAFWTDTNSAIVPSSVGTSEHYLGSKLLVPRLTPSPSDPTSYYVVWEMEDDLVTDTARKAVSAATGPAVNLGIVVYDPTPALSGIYTAISISYNARLFTLWGSPP